MCQTFLSVMRKNGRIVNVSSANSNLNNYSQNIQDRFRNPNKTLQEIETLVEEYEVCQSFLWIFDFLAVQ
jgi:carbonyl reductase 1